jgi:hypothetical protein
MISIAPVSAALAPLAAADGVPVPLSSRFNQALAESYVWAGRERDAILVAANDPAVASDPARIHALQLQLDAYTKQIALSSSLVSHATKGIETLVKS